MPATIAEIETAILDRSPRRVHQRVVAALGYETPESDVPRFADGDPDLDLASYHLLCQRLREITGDSMGEYTGPGWRGLPVLAFCAHVVHILVARGIDPLVALEEIVAATATIRLDQELGFSPSDVAASFHPDVPADQVAALLSA